MINSILIFLKSGGFFMYPIALVGVVSLAIVIERFYSISKNRKIIDEEFKKFNSTIIVDKNKAISQLMSKQSILSSMMHEALDAFTTSKVTKDDFEDLVYIDSLNANRRLRTRVDVIATFANIATLLGLLGTIMGLILSFQAVAVAGADKSSVLSSSVSVAMNTTAFGLMIAIPLLLFYALIDSHSNKTLDYLYIASSKITAKLYIRD